MVTATVFATWFGAETVLGIPATFLQEGLHGVIADPFGASMCLILVGPFFAAPLYLVAPGLAASAGGTMGYLDRIRRLDLPVDPAGKQVTADGRRSGL